MRSWLIASLSLVFAGLVSAPLFAEDAPKKEEAKKEERKGRPNREEILKRFESGDLPPMLLKRFDTNGDGKLDDAEKAKAKEAIAKGRGARGQGGERQLPEAVIKKFDANGDGKLDDAEKAKAREEFQKRRGEGRGKKKAE